MIDMASPGDAGNIQCRVAVEHCQVMSLPSSPHPHDRPFDWVSY